MPFVKGESGNPSGRPKVVGDVQELARQRTVDAVDTLANIMLDEQAAPAARVAAANAILDRGYGKPALLDLILEHGDAATCAAVREYIAERQTSVH